MLFPYMTFMGYALSWWWYALQARKLMKELQAQLAAADAAAALDACMARRPCGSAALKAAISKAEAAASAIAGVTTPSSSSGASAASAAHGSMTSSSSSGAACGAAAGFAAFSEALVCRLQAGKKRLEVERASEALHKASLLYKGVGDLPKLEAAILNARKVSSSSCPRPRRQSIGTAGKLNQCMHGGFFHLTLFSYATAYQRPWHVYEACSCGDCLQVGAEDI
jgi:hypothetical protein